MNKKNWLFVITGIFLICRRFWVSFGTVNIDISNDIVGYILIFLGINNMKELNSRFKKGMFLSLAGLAGAILSQYLIARDWPVPETMYSIAIGISVVFAIYFTYYYTEALVMEARIQEKTAVTRNYQITWLLMSAGIFVQYFAIKSTIKLIMTTKNAQYSVIPSTSGKSRLDIASNNSFPIPFTANTCSTTSVPPIK